MASADQRLVAFGPRPWVMGIVNVTPDSFSDGGQWDTTATAVAHGHDLVAAGADLVDVGGESTRPGAQRVSPEVEMDRVVPVIAELAAAGIACSVDTMRAQVAQAAIDAGAVMINDVSGGRADPDMARLAAQAKVPWVLMHWRGHSDVMDSLASYTDVVIDVRRELLTQVELALAAGVDERALVIDPGLGFAKSADDNWQLLTRLAEIVDVGLPVLVGASRKRFLGSLLADQDGTPRPPQHRDAATAATSLIAAKAGAWGVRVHQPSPTLDALAVQAAVQAAPTRVDAPGPANAPVVGEGAFRFGKVAGGG